MSATKPHELWSQANDEFPGDDKQRRERYLSLMREHGLLLTPKEKKT